MDNKTVQVYSGIVSLFGVSPLSFSAILDLSEIDDCIF